MPLIECSTYRPPLWLRGGHAQTIYPALFRRVDVITHQRERIELEDGDFLDVDWNRSNNSGRVAIVSHGLEGRSSDAYVQGIARALRSAGWDVLAWNCRGCSGEPNRLLQSYHSGATDDLAAVVRHVLSSGNYSRVGLVGFSLGGNITLKYLGDIGNEIDPRLYRAVAFSVPCDLASSSVKLESLMNRIYMKRFLRSLRVKIRGKIRDFPNQVSDRGLDRMRSFREFDGAYTAPMHGFANAEDYWRRASSAPVLERVAIPALLVNAMNDPFLAPACFPSETAKGSDCFHFEAPMHGGHVGFATSNKNKYWSELRAVEFLT